MKTKVIQVPIYHNTIQVLLGDKSEVENTLIKKYKLNQTDATLFADGIGESAGAYGYLKPKNFYCIWLPKVPVYVRDYGSLIHEIEHVVFQFLHNIGMEHTPESDEAFAYLSEYLYCEISNWINQLREEEKQNTNN